MGVFDLPYTQLTLSLFTSLNSNCLINTPCVLGIQCMFLQTLLNIQLYLELSLTIPVEPHIYSTTIAAIYPVVSSGWALIIARKLYLT